MTVLHIAASRPSIAIPFIVITFVPSGDDFTHYRRATIYSRNTGDALFRGDIADDGVTTPFVSDHDMQDTVTLGATARF